MPFTSAPSGRSPGRPARRTLVVRRATEADVIGRALFHRRGADRLQRLAAYCFHRFDGPESAGRSELARICWCFAGDCTDTARVAWLRRPVVGWLR